MQQISAQLFGSQVTTEGTQMLPFTFGMPLEQATEFGDMLQQTIADLQSGELNNAEFAEQLNMIKQNIPDELIADLEETLEEDLPDETEDITAAALAVLSIVDNIIDDLPEIETKQKLETSLQESGISQENIATIFEILDMPEQPTEFKNADIVAKQTEQLSQQPVERPIQAQQVNKFKSNDLSASILFAEKVITGEKLTQTELQQPSIQNEDAKIAELAAKINPSATEVAEETTNITTKSAETTEQERPKKSLSEILSLFKKTKTNETVNLDKSKAAETTDKVIPEKTNVEATKDSVIIANQAQATPKHEMQKTNGELNKSEFKELTSKFIASLSDDSAQTEFTPEVAKSEAVTPTATAMAINKTFTVKTDTKAQFDNFETLDIDTLEQNNETQEIQETKPAPSSLNMQLYKMAQQANIQNQINVAIKNFKGGNQQIKVKLNPEELGSVTIEMEMVDNMARGVITVEKPEVAQQLAQNLNKMFDSFKQAGFNLNSNDIVIQVDDQRQNQQQFAEKDDLEQEIELNLTEDELDIVL